MPTQASDAVARLMPVLAGLLAGAAVAVQLGGGPGWLVVLAWLAAAAAALLTPHRLAAGPAAADRAPRSRGPRPRRRARRPRCCGRPGGCCSRRCSSSRSRAGCNRTRTSSSCPGSGRCRALRPSGPSRCSPCCCSPCAAAVAPLVGDGRPALVTAVWLAVAVALAGLSLALALVGLGGRRGAGARAAAVRAALQRHAPTFVLYTGREDGGVHQIRMWLPYLERLGQPYLVVTRSRQAQRALAAAVDAPVYLAASWRDLDRRSCPACGPRSTSARPPPTRTSWPTGSSPRLPRARRVRQGVVLRALARHVRPHLRGRPGCGRPVPRAGRSRSGTRCSWSSVDPQAEQVRSAGTPRTGSASSGPRTVLYAPTWSGYSGEASHSSLPVARGWCRPCVDAGLRVVFRPHPFSLHRPAERAAGARRWTPSWPRRGRAAAPAHVLSAESAAAVADGRHEPVGPAGLRRVQRAGGLPARRASRWPWSPSAPNRTSSPSGYPSASAAYVVPADLAGLAAMLDDMLGADPLRVASASRPLQYYLGGLSGPAAVAAFEAAARRCLESGGAEHQIGRPLTQPLGSPGESNAHRCGGPGRWSGYPGGAGHPEAAHQDRRAADHRAHHRGAGRLARRRRDHRHDDAGLPGRRPGHRADRRLHQGHPDPRGRRDPQRDDRPRARGARRRGVQRAVPRRRAPAAQPPDHRATAWPRWTSTRRSTPPSRRPTRSSRSPTRTRSPTCCRAPSCAAARRRRASGSSVIRRAYEIAATDPDFTATDDCTVVLRYLPDVPIAVVAGRRAEHEGHRADRRLPRRQAVPADQPRPARARAPSRSTATR